MNSTAHHETIISTDPLVVLTHGTDGSWFSYAADSSALAIRPARQAAMALGFEHREPFDTKLCERQGVRMVGVQMFRTGA